MRKFALYSSMLFPLPCLILSFLMMFPLFVMKEEYYDPNKYFYLCGMICFVESLFALIWNIVKVVKEGEDGTSGTDFVYKVSEYNFGLLSFLSFTVFVSLFENTKGTPIEYIMIFLFFFSIFITSFLSYIFCKVYEEESLRLPWICIAPMVLTLFIITTYAVNISIASQGNSLLITASVFLYIIALAIPGLLLIPFIYLRRY